MSNPLGPYGNAVAAALAVLIVVAAVLSHIVPGFHTDPWLDNAALLAAGVVFGTQTVQNGTQSKAAAALAQAAAANARLDALGAPSSSGTSTPAPAPTPTPPPA